MKKNARNLSADRPRDGKRNTKDRDTERRNARRAKYTIQGRAAR